MAKPKLKVEKPPSKVHRDQSSVIFSLPDEILMHIFDYLGLADLTNIGIVCKWWLYISRSPHFYNRVDLREFSAEVFPVAIRKLSTWLSLAKSDSGYSPMKTLIVHPGIPGRHGVEIGSNDSEMIRRPSPLFFAETYHSDAIYGSGVLRYIVNNNIGENLTKLVLFNLHFDGDLLLELSNNCPSIQDLELDRIRVDSIPEHSSFYCNYNIKLFPALKHVSIVDSHLLSNCKFASQHLLSLRMIHSAFTPYCWQGPGCSHYYDTSVYFDELPELERLHCRVDSSILFSKNALPKLKELKLIIRPSAGYMSPNYAARTDDLEICGILGNLAPDTLENLCLRGCVGFAGRNGVESVLKSQAALRRLDLASTSVNDDGVCTMMRCLRGNPLMELSLAHCNVSDAGVGAVVKHASAFLEVLDLRGARMSMSDMSLQLIASECKKLRRLRVYFGGNLTKLGLLEFVQFRPDVQFDCDSILMSLDDIDIEVPVIPPAPQFEGEQKACKYCREWLDVDVIDDHFLVCGERPVECLMKMNGCSFVGTVDEVRNHLQECPFNRVVCFKCQCDMPRSVYHEHFLQAHLNTATLLSCPLKWYGCNLLFKEHSAVIEHLAVCPYYERENHEGVELASPEAEAETVASKSKLSLSYLKELLEKYK